MDSYLLAAIVALLLEQFYAREHGAITYRRKKIAHRIRHPWGGR